MVFQIDVLEEVQVGKVTDKLAVAGDELFGHESDML